MGVADHGDVDVRVTTNLDKNRANVVTVMISIFGYQFYAKMALFFKSRIMIVFSKIAVF
jgi:hypothetical protein